MFVGYITKIMSKNDKAHHPSPMRFFKQLRTRLCSPLSFAYARYIFMNTNRPPSSATLLRFGMHSIRKWSRQPNAAFNTSTSSEKARQISTTKIHGNVLMLTPTKRPDDNKHNSTNF